MLEHHDDDQDHDRPWPICFETFSREDLADVGALSVLPPLAFPPSPLSSLLFPFLLLFSLRAYQEQQVIQESVIELVNAPIDQDKASDKRNRNKAILKHK